MAARARRSTTSDADGAAAAPPETRGGFRPELGFWSLTFLIVGSMIGSGIFFRPGSMLLASGSVGMVFLAWVLGAVIALSGGLMFAELGAAYPKAGGQYVFLREGMGRLPSFLFSWTGFTVVQSGTMAAVAVAFAESVDRFLAKAWNVQLPGNLGASDLAGHQARCLGRWDAMAGQCVGFELPPWGRAFLAVALVIGLTLLNQRGVKRAAMANNIATVAKIVALVAVILLLLPWPDAGNFGGLVASDPLHPGPGQVAEDPAKFNVFLGLGAAVAASLFAYDGFAQATFVAGEVKDPRRTVPRAIVAAGVGVAAIYILTTFSVFHAMPASALSPGALTGQNPATLEALDHVFSGTAGLVIVTAIAAGIAISTFGTVNAYVLASPRIYHAVAEDGEFPRPFGVLSRDRTPTYGLWYGAIWASLLTLSGGFDTIADLTVFGLYVFYLLTVIAYFRLWLRDRDAFSGFRVPLRPLPAVVFGVGAVYVLGTYVLKDLPAMAQMVSPLDVLRNTTLFGVLLIGSGFLVYWGMKAKARKAATA